MRLALVFDPVKRQFDLSLNRGRLVTTPGIESLVTIALFSDRRAADDDALPDDAIGPFGDGRKGGGDRRGWWADAVAVDGLVPTPIGSRLWLLRRCKTTPDTLMRAQAYAEEALGFLVARGLATAVSVTVTRQDNDVLALAIAIELATGVPLSLDHVYDLRG